MRASSLEHLRSVQFGIVETELKTLSLLDSESSSGGDVITNDMVDDAGESFSVLVEESSRLSSSKVLCSCAIVYPTSKKEVLDWFLESVSGVILLLLLVLSYPLSKLLCLLLAHLGHTESTFSMPWSILSQQPERSPT